MGLRVPTTDAEFRAVLVNNKPMVGLLLVSSADVARNCLANHRTWSLRASFLHPFHRKLGEKVESKSQKNRERRAWTRSDACFMKRKISEGRFRRAVLSPAAATGQRGLLTRREVSLAGADGVAAIVTIEIDGAERAVGFESSGNVG